jgi:uncharacterized protein YjbJ (UPF0337 family)
MSRAGGSRAAVQGGTTFPLSQVAQLNQSIEHTLSSKQEKMMDKEHAKGAVDKAKGAVKDAVGGLTGDTGMQVEGKVDKAKGSVRQKVGDDKDAARDAIDKA